MGNTILWLVIASGVVAGLMEVIKFKGLNNNTQKKHGMLFGILLSLVITPIVYFGFDLAGHYIAMALYFCIIYIVQKQMDMKAIRPVIKSLIKRKIENL